MKRLQFTYFLLFWLCTDTAIFAQSVEDTVEINEITIFGKFNFADNFEHELTDSLQFANQISSSAATFLNQYSSLYSRSYGTGLYSSVLVRGNYPAQVKWNDFDVSNSMLGVADLSLIAINPTSTFRINTNDNLIGTTGGSVKISDDNFRGINGLSAQINYNTLNNTTINAAYGLNQTNLKYYLGIGVQNNQNRFNFRSGNEIKPIDNSASQKYNINYSSYFVRGKNIIRVFGLYNYSVKEIPPSRYEGFSNAFQLDENFKTGIHYDVNFNSLMVKLRTGIFYDRLDYDNDKTGEHTQSKMLTSESGVDLLFANSKILNPSIGLTNKIHSVNSTVYDVDFENIIYFNAGLKKRFKRFNYELKVNTGVFEGKMLPVLPDLLINFKVNAKSNLILNAGRNLRLPSYNDRFWNKNINYDLLPEKSNSLDLTYRFRIDDYLLIQSVIYIKKLNDNIIWLPEDGIWKAANIDVSNTYGIEIEGKLTLNAGQVKINMNNVYKYNKTRISDNEKGIFLNDALYYPEHLFFADQHAVWKKFFFRLSERFYGKVFTNYDNSEFIDPWYLIDIQIAYDFNVKNFCVKTMIGIENSLNDQYETIKNYTQPGRVFSFGMIFRQTK